MERLLSPSSRAWPLKPKRCKLKQTKKAMRRSDATLRIETLRKGTSGRVASSLPCLDHSWTTWLNEVQGHTAGARWLLEGRLMNSRVQGVWRSNRSGWRRPAGLFCLSIRGVRRMCVRERDFTSLRGPGSECGARSSAVAPVIDNRFPLWLPSP